MTSTKRCSTSIEMRGARTGRARGTSRRSCSDGRPCRPRRRASRRRTASGASRGQRATMRSSAGRKPMSSMRSASSITSVRTLSSLKAPRSSWSSSRPGVATTMCARSATCACLSRPTPPYTAAILQRAGVSDRAQLLDDLGRELTRGRQHEYGRPARLGGRAVDKRDPEGERLARPGGGTGQHVATGEHIADHHLLDRERRRDPAAGKSARRRRSTRRDRRRTA